MVSRSDMMIKRLTGHSGCKVLLCSDESGRKLVRKISSSKDYNLRLVSQCEKQKDFKSSSGAQTPNVFRQGYLNRLFYFDMDYIQGKLMSDRVDLLDAQSLDPYLKTIVSHFEDDEHVYSDMTSSIIKKTEDLKSSLPKKYEKYIEMVSSANWENLPAGNCHGDFTLENMIVSNGKLFLIDFLDSFVDTKLLDVSKLLFDVRYFWSKRHLKRKAVVKSIFVENYITNTELYRNYNETINRLVILNILRIIPYCVKIETANYLEGCLEHAAR